MNSEFSDKCITPAQKLAEIMCQRMAKKKGVALPYRFWQFSEWKVTFRRQVQLASALLKIHTFKAIINALNRNETKNVYSFAGKWWQYLIPLEEERLLKETAKLTEVDNVHLPESGIDQTGSPRFNIGTKRNSTLSKLD